MQVIVRKNHTFEVKWQEKPITQALICSERMTVLISKKIVQKKFLQNHSSLFFNEIFWLKKLKKYNCVPKIINIDFKNLIISISYEGKQIEKSNKPTDWKNQLKKILIILKKNNCFHSDIKPDNLLVKNKKLTLIDFAQSTKISNLKKNFFFKKRIFYDKYSINRINLSINRNQVISNDLRLAVIWNSKNQISIEKKIEQSRDIEIIDKIKIKKDFYSEKFKDRIFWIDQFYNKKISKKSDKLKDNIFVYVIKSINPKFKLNKMIFTEDIRVVDDKIFKFKRKIRKNKSSIIHIADNFEEAKRNAIFFSKSIKNFPAKYFYKTQHVYENKKEFFKNLNKFKKLKYVVLRDQKSNKEDLDILTNNYYLFKRLVDCHSYKKKNLNLISNSGDPVEENGIKVSNYVMIKNKALYLDVRYINDDYYDVKWQKKILENRKYVSGYFVPNSENKLYTLIYHIVYHKGYIDKKYIKILKKNLKNFNFLSIKDKVDRYLKLKNYKLTRPKDLTIPVIFKLSNLLLDKELKLIKNQILQRNFSGANKMMFNIIKFQPFFVYFNSKILLLLIENQFYLLKAIIKKAILKYISLN